ncbi:Uncharacterised protein [Serratia quinivorans]|nr:Uncharacterised protein [Serratia proteamaculans]CAI1217345.1 Uncharacterised protein [Serratia proteamaculans]CAI1222027.1 Uncharacterised protein [Serratia proteamaculans]CAI2000126.1 Uncharacterised protein [Serratia proteamaculans]SPZ55468.1 Uncharacterised protein [Serratia quinivorans]
MAIFSNKTLFFMPLNRNFLLQINLDNQEQAV